MLYRRDGTVPSEYLRKGYESHIGDARRAGTESVIWKDEYLQLSRPISFQGRQIGELSLESEMSDLREERRQLAKVVLPLFAGVQLLIAVLTMLLQRSITAPIEQLAGLARKVTKEEAYSLRTPALPGKELRNLGSDFNHMLEAIEKRDHELREAQESLEERVSERRWRWKRKSQ